MCLAVFPSRVGMVRFRGGGGPCLICFPHAREDGPVMHRGRNFSELLSPRSWGWSEILQIVAELLSVIPTLVGMVRFRYNRLHLLDLL